MRKFIFRDDDGNRIVQMGTTLIGAMRESGANIAALAGESAPQCGGDCGDCNEARNCATTEQATL